MNSREAEPPHRPANWDGLIDAIGAGGVPPDFLGPEERSQGSEKRDPLAESPQ